MVKLHCCISRFNNLSQSQLCINNLCEVIESIWSLAFVPSLFSKNDFMWFLQIKDEVLLCSWGCAFFDIGLRPQNINLYCTKSVALSIQVSSF